jgi:hypothetical protein
MNGYLNVIHALNSKYRLKLSCESSLHYHMKIIGVEQLKKVKHLMFVEQIKHLIKPGKKYGIAVVFKYELIYSTPESSIARYPLHLQRAAC